MLSFLCVTQMLPSPLLTNVLRSIFSLSRGSAACDSFLSAVDFYIVCYRYFPLGLWMLCLLNFFPWCFTDDCWTGSFWYWSLGVSLSRPRSSFLVCCWHFIFHNLQTKRDSPVKRQTSAGGPPSSKQLILIGMCTPTISCSPVKQREGSYRMAEGMIQN